MAEKSLPAFLLALLFILKADSTLGDCQPSGVLIGTAGHCNTDNNAECCQAGKQYNQYRCSPPITGQTRVTMTINSFEEGGDGGGRWACDDSYHSNQKPVVALSTGWYSDRSRCGKNIRINANGRSVLAKVFDHCDSVNGCDKEHDFQPPCANNIVDASRAVWDELGIPESQIGEKVITWSDA